VGAQGNRQSSSGQSSRDCCRPQVFKRSNKQHGEKHERDNWCAGFGGRSCGVQQQRRGGHEVPAITDGLDGSRRLSDLTPDELDRFCDNGRANYLALSESSIELYCRSEGFFDSSYASKPESACKEAVETCLAEEEPNESGGDCEIPENCIVTVDEYAACLDEFSQLIHGGVDVVPSCSERQATERPRWLLLRPLRVSSRCPSRPAGFWMKNVLR